MGEVSLLGANFAIEMKGGTVSSDCGLLSWSGVQWP